MVYEILVRFPEKSLNCCKCVSKAWQSLISSPRFIQEYKARHHPAGLLVWSTLVEQSLSISDFYYFQIGFRRPAEPSHRLQLPDPVCGLSITNVINGIVCFYDSNHLFVVNVFTGEFKKFPFTGNSRRYIFGFDTVSGVYKLLGLGPCSAEILSLGLGGWRRVEVNNRLMEIGVEGSVCFTDVDSVVYYMVRVESVEHLVSFDFNSEKFRYIRMPKQKFYYTVKLGTQLALVKPDALQGRILSYYILEDSAGNEWSKHFAPLPKQLTELAEYDTSVLSGNLAGGRILLSNYLEAYYAGLDTPVYSYDHQTREFELMFLGVLPVEVCSPPPDAPPESGPYYDGMLCVEENCTKLDVLFNESKPS